MPQLLQMCADAMPSAVSIADHRDADVLSAFTQDSAMMQVNVHMAYL